MTAKTIISIARNISESIEDFDVVAGITATFLYWRTANLAGALAGVVAYIATVNQSLLELLLHFRPNPTILVVFAVTQFWSLLWHIVAIVIHSKKRMSILMEYLLRVFVWMCLLGFASILLAVFEFESDTISLALKVWISVAYVLMEGFIYTLPALFGSKPRFFRWLQTVEMGLRGGAKAISTLSSIREEAEKGFSRLGDEEEKEP